MLRLGVRGWELHSGPECGDCTPMTGLRDRFWAHLWLRQFKSDPAVLSEIRRLVARSNTAWSLHKATADQAIDSMAGLLHDGEWHVHAPVLPDSGGLSGETAPEEKDLAEVAPSLPALKESPEPPPPPQEEGLLPRNADEEAIASSMTLASQLGIPFCEECAKAALKQAREAAVA